MGAVALTPPAAGAANMSCQTENRPPEQYRDLMGAVPMTPPVAGAAKTVHPCPEVEGQGRLPRGL